MSSIKRLEAEVAGKIAAGEVIERPASAVKELVENALDASAERIDVRLSDGGRSLIRVEDDGSGIPAAELPIAVQNFSTSKIAGIEDLECVNTLGFRGEALASILAVSRLTIGSRSRWEEVGREMQWSAGKLLKDAPFVRNPGTDVTAESLFFNLPARRKFLRSGRSELRRIITLMHGFALAFPGSGFTLRDNGREIFSWPASGLRERVETVLGYGAAGRLKSFESESGKMRMHGYVSMPDLTRGNRSMQFFFVNRRHVRDRLLSHAANQAYTSLIPGNRYPLVVIFLEIPPDAIDVNVHPTKAEIRFKSEREVHRFVSSRLRETLQGSGQSFREKVLSVYQSIFPRSAEGQSIAHETGAAARAPDAEQAALGLEPVGDRTIHEAPRSLFSEEAGGGIDTSGRLYWQLHDGYILIQIRGGMVIVDQHAAHERILFDRAKLNIGGRKAAVQSLLFPSTLELSPEEYERFEELSGILPKLGFIVEPFGARAVIARGIPAGVRNWNEGRLLQDILCGRETRGSGTDDFLKTFACRAAIKAGSRLSVDEMESLADQLFSTDFPFTCPHGRPTMLRVDLADLERRFQRTVSAEK